ncbi:hypothetical protein [Marinomonas mediterranea]|uniref:hypothetical protein n=1 Tax=Marinomonas mediterranea TaxID=119864 RepID=UPI002349BD53|nr:hypothetical protein [Marinomonas mediterranea]WCN10712.1 hypothetical protein GV055_18165 [Marinomonas mediterranea]WCN14769.1 hypothetical protein GV054_18040 [Marinomonas mediterranea]
MTILARKETAKRCESAVRKTHGVNQALNDAYLKKAELVSLRDGLSFTILSETPCAEAHTGLYGGWWLGTYGYPIMCKLTRCYFLKRHKS